MKSIRIRNFASLLLCSLLIFGNTACKKDKEEDECVPPALETQIMTTWQATISNLLTIPIGFTANGELTGNLSSVLSELPMLSNIDDVDRKSTRLNSSHVKISYAVFCLKKKNK